MIQAHTKSKRFPNKIYAELNGAPVLFHVLNNVNLCSYISTTVVAAPESLEVPPNTDLFVDTGEDKDVLGRFYRCMKQYDPDYIVRITSDCPILDPFLIDYVVMEAILHKADYCTNVFDRYNYTFPDGQDVEVISKNMLEWLNNVIRSDYGREHVTIELRTNSALAMGGFNFVSIENDTNYGAIKQSIDTEEELRKLNESQK